MGGSLVANYTSHASKFFVGAENEWHEIDMFQSCTHLSGKCDADLSCVNESSVGGSMVACYTSQASKGKHLSKESRPVDDQGPGGPVSEGAPLSALKHLDHFLHSFAGLEHHLLGQVVLRHKVDYGVQGGWVYGHDDDATPGGPLPDIVDEEAVEDIQATAGMV
ncbi:hypothetical protein HPB49_005862 [Dermacentor silvarum]|uniref:Uncharacterized protein n=1 Tax=Dermacentor silvarum TaxID=543639 RepID=A0ACB8DI94_DERSI|nr:hypothetical protein HPB49_005862 [Dermacentor silvarum]